MLLVVLFGEEGWCIGLCDSETRTREEKLRGGMEKDLMLCSAQQRHAVFRRTGTPGCWLSGNLGIVSQNDYSNEK